MRYDEALAYLDEHASYDTTGRIESPTLERVTRLMHAIGDPQHTYPVIHVTGTNGKGSTTQMITRLLMAHGLTVGTYTSPHLERLNERIARNCEPISDDEFGEQIGAIAEIELLAGVRPSYFEALTAAALRWFSDVAVDVAVVEVGLLGRWDATNVCTAQVAVVTNIGMDHMEFAGPTKAHIAREKAGIIKPTSAVVIGETEPDLVSIFTEAGGASCFVRGDDFDVLENQLALGGRMVDLRTPTTIYSEVFVPLHGSHQASNAAVALTAVEAFFASPVDEEVLREGFADVVMPGRFEVLGHQPLVIIDGAHNPPGPGVLRRLRPGRDALPRGGLPPRSRTGRDAVGAAGRRVRRGAHLHCAIAAWRAGGRSHRRRAGDGLRRGHRVCLGRAGVRTSRAPRRWRRRRAGDGQPVRGGRRPPGAAHAPAVTGQVLDSLWRHV
jgi:dihydrofolate synthase/folylpolyglutamate synthase